MARDKEWAKLFEIFPIEECIKRDGYFEITATQINRVKEARLMAKFDHYEDLPGVFKNNNYAIMPTSRGSYVIAPMNLYHTFEDVEDNVVTKIQWSHNLESIDINNITSETVALNVADIAGIFGEFLNERPTFATLAGRMGSSNFEFCVEQPKGKLFNIQVDRAQIEIDGSYETPCSYAIIEAKNKYYRDFLIRQLYYPYRMAQGLVSHKIIRPIFMMYYNRIFHLYEYEFQDTNNYNSIHLLRHANYSLDDTAITFDDIRNVFYAAEVEPEDLTIPFPQADSIERLINLIEIIGAGKPLKNHEIAMEFGIKGRQGCYYSNAGRYLGLLECRKNIIRFDEQENEVECTGKFLVTSELGTHLLQLNYKQRHLTLFRLLMQHQVINIVIKRILNRTENNTVVILSRHEISDIMRGCTINIGTGTDDMYNRRASTIRHWVSWMFRLCKDIDVVK